MTTSTASSSQPMPITVVSGLPRSGTSMMMRALTAGGLEPVTDRERIADDDNPLGYFEFERVKALADGDTAWVAEAPGRVVKVIAALLPHLPSTHRYDVIFMEREMSEVLASQRRMLQRRGEDANAIPDELMASLFERHVREARELLDRDARFRSLFVSYNACVARPAEQFAAVSSFLTVPVDADAMAAAVEPSLYRNRAESGSQRADM